MLESRKFAISLSKTKQRGRPKQGHGLDPEWMQLSFSALVWAFLVVVMVTVNCHGAGWLCHSANVL